MEKFKIYFSKTSKLPCVEYNEQLYKAEHLEVNVPIKGEWQPFGESPSWVLTGECKSISYSEEKSLIVID